VREDEVRLAMAVFVSLVLLGTGLYVLVGDHGGPDLQKLARGWVGGVVGYWLK
jgi:hypothetical protein